MRILALLLVAGILAGCTAPVTAPADTTEPYSLTAPAAAVASHPAAARDETPVMVTGVPLRYTASMSITIHNTLAGFPGAAAHFSSPGGPVMVSAGGDGYVVVAKLSATATTEADARAALATIHLDNADAVDGGVLRVSAVGRMDDLATNPTLLQSTNRDLDLDVKLQPSLAYALQADSSGGAVHVSGLHGPDLQASSSGGTVTVTSCAFTTLRVTSSGGAVTVESSSADAARVSSSGGAVDATLRGRSATISSSGGAVTVNWTPTSTGTLEASSSGGGVSVALARADGTAYDASAHSSGGSTSVHLHDAGSSSSDDNDAHARSADWANATIQSTVDAHSSGGSVSVHD